MITMQDVQRGYDDWAAQPHNAKWVRKLDGTPIANDIVVRIFTALQDIHPAPSSTGVVGEWQDISTAPQDGTVIYLWNQKTKSITRNVRWVVEEREGNQHPTCIMDGWKSAGMNPWTCLVPEGFSHWMMPWEIPCPCGSGAHAAPQPKQEGA